MSADEAARTDEAGAVAKCEGGPSGPTENATPEPDELTLWPLWAGDPLIVTHWVYERGSICPVLGLDPENAHERGRE